MRTANYLRHPTLPTASTTPRATVSEVVAGTRDAPVIVHTGNAVLDEPTAEPLSVAVLRTPGIPDAVLAAAVQHVAAL